MDSSSYTWAYLGVDNEVRLASLVSRLHAFWDLVSVGTEQDQAMRNKETDGVPYPCL